MTRYRPTMPLGALASLVPGGLVERGDGVNVAGISYDSRKVGPGDLFVALVGGYFDGHDFLAQAAANGACAAMVERPMPVELPQLIVPDTRSSLARAAAAFYGRPSEQLDVIGITGTDGKTTTTYLIDAIFRHAGCRTGVIGTVSVRIGDAIIEADTRQTTPESLDLQRHLRSMVDSGVDVAIVEATSHGLDLHRLDEVRFVTGAVTGITHEHLEHHGTVEAYRRAKGRLFEMVGSADGTAVINLDDEGARSMLHYASGARIIRFGIVSSEAEIRAFDVELGLDGTAFTLAYEGVGERLRMPLVGGFNVTNALCAAGVALAHDISPETICKALESAPSVPGRMQAIRAGQPFTVIVDYAHTPDSVEKVLRLIRELSPESRVIVVMGSAGERDREKRARQGAVAATLADLSYFTSEDPRCEDADTIIAEIAAGALDAGGFEGKSFVRVTDREEAVHSAVRAAKPGDCVLLLGKGHERSIIWGLEKRPWDEVAVATNALAAIGYQGGTT